MKKTNYYVLSLLMAAGLAACSAEIDSTQQQGDQVPLQLTATKLVDNAEVQESHARRAANNLYVSSFDGGESVKVWLNDTDNGDDYAINSTDHTTLEGGSLYYPAGSTGTATVFALYPSTSTSSHTVAYNQSGDAAYKQSDLMYATKTVNLSEKTSSQALQFSHQLVKLHVNIVKGSGVTSITSVKMKNVKRQVTVTPAASTCTIGVATAASDGNGDEIIIFSGSGTAATQDYACVFPIQAWSDQDFIEIQADGQTATYKLTRDSWTKGSSYTLTLNVNAATLGTTTSISGWTDTASATVTAGGGDFTIADIPAETYNGSAKTPTPVVSYNNNTLTLNDDYTLEYAGNINAGTAAVIAIGKGSYVGKVGVKEFTINKADPTYTAPKAVKLTYNGNAQNLVTAGTTSHGVIKYATSENGDYSATIPQQTNAGTYNVWWKLEGDANHNDVAATQVTGVSIAKANCTVALSATKLTVAVGSSNTFTVTRSGNGTITASSSNNSVATTSVNQSTGVVTVNKVAAGTATITVTVAASDNYNAYTTTDKLVSVNNPLAELTSSAVGKLIGADGNVYATASAATSAGTTACAMIAYVGDQNNANGNGAYSTYYNHGLAIALADAIDTSGNPQTTSSHSSYMTFSNASTACTKYKGSRPSASSAWFMPSAYQWERMLIACGSSATYVAYNSQSFPQGKNGFGYGNFRTLLTNCGTNAQGVYDVQTKFYWSSTVLSSNTGNAWHYDFENSRFYWRNKTDPYPFARAVFAF